MKSDYNKENNPPNKTSSLFSNPLISSKVEISGQNQFIEFPPYESTKTISYHHVLSQQSGNTKLYSQHKCSKHMKPLSNLFCISCLDFNVCRTCISDQHSKHQVMQFGSFDEMLSETKEMLLENLEETLKELKRKQNDVKNRTHEINLVRNSLRNMEEEIVGLISGLFRQLQGKLTSSLQKHQDNFNKGVEHFFNEFNKTNDQLRDSLIKILEGDINIVEFNKSMIIKQAPPSPNFMNHKNILERYKKIFKDVKHELGSLKKVLEQGCENICQQQTITSKANTNAGLTKFDKYITTNNNQKGEKVNESFMKTLKLLEMGGDKQNLLMIMNRDKGKTKDRINNGDTAKNSISKKIF